LLESHKDIRVFTFNLVQQAFVGRTLVVVREPLKFRVNPEVLASLQKLSVFLTPKGPQQGQVGTKKQETEVRVSEGLEIAIETDIGIYRTGFEGVKVEMSRLASVTKQVVQVSRFFLYHEK